MGMKMSNIDRDVVIFRHIDIIIMHDRQDDTVSVEIYDKGNKLLAGSTTRLIK